MYRLSKVIHLYALSLACLGCYDEGEKQKYEEFFRLSPSKQDSIISTYPLRDQVEIFVLARSSVHPPLPLTRAVARNGANVVPFVLEKLEETRQERVKVDLLNVLALMSCQYHDLSRDSIAIGAAKQALDAMSREPWRRRAESALKRIQGHNCIPTWPMKEEG